MLRRFVCTSDSVVNLTCRPFIHSIFFSSIVLAPNHAWSDDSESDPKSLEKLVVVGQESEILELEESANAVDVIDLKADQSLTADLSEVLAREPGISIRRMGGLGSRERFSLNGLRDEQVRFFIDGIPVEMTGYTFGLSTIPVNLVERAEIYHGVVPIKYGVDALGGLVNLITDKGTDGTGGSVSHLIGDFNTTRSTLNLNYSDNKSGFFSRFNSFYDYSDNNYEVDVTVPNELGTPIPTTVERFHDAYEGKGANLDFGFRDQRWADLFQLSFYSSEYYRELQHNISMTQVYGEATVERKTYGSNLRYQKQLTEAIRIEAAGGLSESNTEFIDTADYSYIWTGEEIITPVPHPGEIGDACECEYWRNSEFSIVHLNWNLVEGHALNFSAAPTWHRQTGASEIKREMFSLVMGADYNINLLDDRLENTFFVKRYSQERESEQIESFSGAKEFLDSSVGKAGWGNATSYKFFDWLTGKISYEQATRLPNFQEVFGDDATIIPNTELKPEYSNNFNLSVLIQGLNTKYGTWKGDAGVFLRDVEDAIILRTVNDVSQYDNVGAVDSTGIQMSAAWSSPENFIDISANFTTFDLINKSEDTLFAQFKNERIPNEPYRFFNSKVGLNWLGVFAGYDELTVNWNYRFVDRFELLWGDDGASQDNPYFVAAQESHALATTYTKDIFPYVFTLTAEVQNLTDEKLYDHYGVQRPGRAFYLKTIIEF